MSSTLDTAGRAAPRPAPSRWLDSRAGQRLLAAGPFVALGLVLLMLWGVVAWFSIVYPQRLMDEYKRELASQTAAASAQTEAVLRDAEGNLRTLDLWLLTRSRGDPLNDASLVQLAEALRGTSRELVDVMLASADGRLFRLPAQPGQPFATLPKADFITLLASPEAEGVMLGAPLQLRAGGPIYLPLAMRMSAPVGELQSLVAMVDTRRLAELLRPYSRGDESAVALLRSDGLGLLRVPELAGFVGRDLFADEPRRRQLLAGASGSFVSSGAATDGLARLVSFETLNDFGVQVLLAQGLSATLGNHAEQRDLLLTLSAVISVAALLITLMLARMQRAARERDAALLATSDASPLGLFRCDAQGRIIYANETYLRLHGFGAERQEWGWLAMVPEAERAQVRERWRERVGQGEAINAMRQLLRPDGQQRLFSVRTAPLRVNGRVVGAAGTVDDVTERVAQRQAELTLGAIFDRTPDYVCQFDAEGRLRYLNPAGRQRLGLAPDAALDALDFRRFMRSIEPHSFLDTIPAEALQQGHWQGRSAVLDLQGRAVPVASTVLVHRNERQQIATVSVLLRDISNQVQAQHERERSEAMLKAVAEAAATMIAVLDREQRLLFFNRAFAQRFQIEREPWLGRPLSELLGATDYALSRPLIETALAGRSAHLEKRYTDPPLVIELHYAPLQLESGEIEGVISIARDITEVRTEEARLRDASQTDPLTQLLNRSGFALRADEQLAHARQHNSLLTLLYLDLDRFKPVNDQHGHPVGDALLRAVAGRLRHALRPQDLVARLGGDEFAVLLPALPSAADAEAVAAKLLRVISQPFSIEALELGIGVSIGFCVAAGGSADLDTMVAEADARLYEAKRAGRGCYRGGPATAAPPPA
ncbi:diguanylate cyclase domain-containing protein [Roseateles cavernae]|uniref:diguanylate cyclase domain-containing protein n=1 Tax=Roseateles cavernae TaxID=3153578 RepID=UPI0032E4CCD5